MSTLYTCVSQNGKKDIIILNPKYSLEELAEKLKPTGYSEDRIDTILNEGRQLQKELKIRCRADGRITTEDEEDMIYYFYKGDTVILYPDAYFCIKPSLFRRIIFG